jgi:paraquat-inducible protein A
MLTACHDCDLVVEEPPVPQGDSAICPRCGALLLKRRKDSIERTLALTVAGLLLFVVANLFPFLTFEMQGQSTQTTLISGSRDLYEQGQQIVAGLVLLTTIVAPLLQLGLLLYILGPLHLGRRPRGLALAFRWVQHARNWSMMEVFLIGILVSLVKLMDMANIVPGIALWAFALLIPILAAASSTLDPDEIWAHVEVSR